MSEDSNSFQLMNQPYISYGNRNIRKPYHTIAYQNSIIPSYQSESLLKNSQMNNEGNYPKQFYSQSSTNLNIQSYDLSDSQVKVIGRERNQQQKHSLQYSVSQHNNNNNNNNELSIYNGNQGGRSIPNFSIGNQSVQSINKINSSQQQQSNIYNNPGNRQNSRQATLQQQSTQLLHEKIFYLQKQLQQLTKILQQQSKHSYSGQQYEQIAIQNAQLTIKVQELQQQITKINTQKQRTEQQLIQLGQQYERAHQINNELREKILQQQQKITLIQKNINTSTNTTITQRQSQAQSQLQSYNNNNNNNTNVNISSSEQKHSSSQQYTANLQGQVTRLNQQIQNLLTKLHNNNIEFNEQQQSKQQLMQKLNEQLSQIQTLRKQLSDYQVQNLQLQQMNSYLKQQITQVNSMSVNKLKEIQQKYIRGDMDRQQRQEQMQAFNVQLQEKVAQLESHIEIVTKQNEELRIKLLAAPKPQTFTPPKSQPFRDLFGNEDKLKQEITLLNQQLFEEKQRHSLIKTQYTEMLQNQQTQINQLELQNKKVIMQNRTLKIEIEDRQKQIQQSSQQCQQIKRKMQQIKQTKSMEVVNRNVESNRSSYSESQRMRLEERIRYEQRMRFQERMRYEDNIRSLNQKNKQLVQAKQQQFADYQLKISRVEDQLKNTKYQIQRLSRSLQAKQQEIRQKDYLAHQLMQLQNSHQQLIEEVKLIKKSKTILQQEMRMKEENIKKNHQQEGEIIRHKKIVDEKEIEIKRLYDNVKNKDSKIDQLNQQNNNLKQQLQHLHSQQNNKAPEYIKSPPQKQHQQHSPTSCPLCPQVLKQFTIYKQLMQLKFQTMNQMFDDIKISFTRAQFQMREEINKDKSKYENWIEKYDQHDREYRVLMERLWEWEKLNAQNQILRNDVNGKGGRSVSGNNNDNFIKGHSKSTYGNIRKNSAQHGKSHSPSGHLSDIQYDLYLIKLQNSTLRSQIVNLEKQITQKGKGPQTQRQIQQMKRFSDNLLTENQQLKNRLTQIVSQKKISSSKDVSNYQNQQGKHVSIFQRYSSQNMSSDTNEKARSQQKALASAELFINKLKKENDQLIEVKRILQQELDQQDLRNRSLIKQIQAQRQKNQRLQQQRGQISQKTQVLDRYNLPIEYIKYHPEHKKLQTQYVALKRSYLEMQFQYKKSKQSLQQNLQKLKIENDFHQERINELEKNQKSTNLFSFNNKFNEINNNGQQSSEKQRALEERCKYLQEKLQIKQKQCELFIKKYESLMKQMAFNPKTPRNKTQSIHRIDKIAQNIEVSPIQSPQWQQNSAQQNSQRYFDIGQVSFDEKCVQKLRVSMDKKILELEITPRQTSNLIIKATWFIQRLFTDIKQLRNNTEILKGQRKAIMKQRNNLKQKLQNIDQVSISDRSKPFAKNKTNKTETNHVLDDSINTGLNKIKISKGYQSVPKLDFNLKSQTPRDENVEGDENAFNNVIKQTLQLKNQRRSGLKKFQQQVQKLTYN